MTDDSDYNDIHKFVRSVEDLFPITAAFEGNDNWEWQLRDTDGRWIFMGGLARFFARLPNGKIGSGVGKIVKITSPTQAIIRVDPKNGGDVPSGEYLADSKNIKQASAVLPESTLRKMGIKFNPPADQSSIPNLADMGKGAASEKSSNYEYGEVEVVVPHDPDLDVDRSPFSSMARPAGDAKSLPEVSVDGWDRVSASDYLDTAVSSTSDSIFNDLVTNPDRRPLIDAYKREHGENWENKLRSDIQDLQREFASKQEDAFDNVDMYRLGNVTVAISKEFRKVPDKLKAMLDNIKKLHDKTKNYDGPVMVTILGNDIPTQGRTQYNGYARSNTVAYLDDKGQPVRDQSSRSMVIDASALLPENESTREMMLDDFRKNRKRVADGKRTYSTPASYGGDIDTFIDYVTTHEWGHMLDFGDNPDGVTEKVDFGKSKMDAAQFSARLAKLLQANPWIYATLSEYGISNPYEAFAELFAQVFMEEFSGAGVDSRIPNALRDFIKKYVL